MGVDFNMLVIPQTPREWNRTGKGAIVSPDNGSVTPTQLSASTVTYITDNAQSISDAGIAAHVAEDNPHAQYALIPDVATTAANAASNAVSTHVAQSDPHTQYFNTTRGDARYQPLAAVLSMLHTGTGSPEGALTAPVGHLYLRSDGGASTTLYVKEAGSGSSGWVAK